MFYIYASTGSLHQDRELESSLVYTAEPRIDTIRLLSIVLSSGIRSAATAAGALICSSLGLGDREAAGWLVGCWTPPVAGLLLLV